MISRRAFVSLALAAAAPRPALAWPGGRRLVIGLSLRPESLDPTTQSAAVIGEVVHGNILEGLTWISESGQAVPLLASRWDVSADRLRYRFRLRDGVRFHDGAALTPQVVAGAFRRIQSLGHRNKLADTFRNIRQIGTPDSATVELSLSHADPFLPFRLGESPAVILHPDTAGQASRHPVGTGPYRLVRWDAQGDIELSRWQDYRQADRARIDAARFRFIPDPERQVREVLDQRVDLLFRAAAGGAEQLAGSRAHEILLGSSSSKGLLAINHRRPYLGDVRVRRAIMHAIDREAFIRGVLQGRGRAIGSHFVPTDPDYINLTALYPYDPDKARALLREAGVRAPLELDLSLPPTPYAMAGGPFIIRSLGEVGIRVNPVPVSWSQWMSRVFHQADFDLSLILHVEPLDYYIYARPDYYFGYDSPAFRALVARHAVSGSPREQGRLFQDIQRQLAEDAVNAWIFTPEVTTVVRKGLKGVQMDYPIFAHDIRSMYWMDG